MAIGELFGDNKHIFGFTQTEDGSVSLTLDGAAATAEFTATFVQSSGTLEVAPLPPWDPCIR